MADSKIYFDVRFLQEFGDLPRETIQRLTALLAARRQSAFSVWRTIALADLSLPKLRPAYSRLFDEITASVNPSCGRSPAIFLDMAPMKHSPRRTFRFFGHDGFLRVAAPLDLAEQEDSADVAERIVYLARLARLRDFDLCFHPVEAPPQIWGVIEAAIENRLSPSVSKKRRLAFLSPYAPDRSVAAAYTAMSIQMGQGLFESALFTGNAAGAPLITGQYDSVISVLGDSSHRVGILKVFERYGGPCILHDIPSAEICHALIKLASPVMVHTTTQQELLKSRCGAQAALLTCYPSILLRQEELTEHAKQSARMRHALADSTFVIGSFDDVGRPRLLNTYMLALELIRSWGVPAQLYFLGQAPGEQAELERLSDLYGLLGSVHFGISLNHPEAYQDFLMASDVAVQVGPYRFGQPSIPLTDCIAAGLPSVATADMARSVDAPDYVFTVPDRFSALQLAEQLTVAWERPRQRTVHEEQRIDYLRIHNFEYYLSRLVEALGLG